jgi:hypothetical protein
LGILNNGDYIHELILKYRKKLKINAQFKYKIFIDSGIFFDIDTIEKYQDTNELQFQRGIKFWNGN